MNTNTDAAINSEPESEPEYGQIIKALRQLQERVSVLESEREEMQLYIKKSKLSVSKVLRLPKNTPDIGFREWIHAFQVNHEHVDIVINIGTYEGFIACVEFNMNASCTGDTNIPFVAFIHKPKFIYIFETADELNDWKIMDDVCLKSLVQCIWVKMIKTYLGMDKDSSVSEDIHESNQNMIADARNYMGKKQKQSDLKKWLFNKLIS